MIPVLLLFLVHYPDKALTPGVTRNVSVKELCRVGSTKDARFVTDETKLEVLQEYHIAAKFVRRGKSRILMCGKSSCGSQYEIDHFISLEDGGANNIHNLWPEPMDEARKKDVVETYLHRQMCAGKITLQQAQDGLRIDWYKTYLKWKKRK